jgi:hypothetical protein
MNTALGKIVTVCLLLFLMNILFPLPAHAYLDPGTGSYVFQLLIAALLGLAFLLKVFWGRIRDFFAILLSKDGEKRKEDEHGEPAG